VPTCFSIGKKTQKINNRMWFFNVGISGKNGAVNNRQFRTLETMLKNNKHTEARLLFDGRSSLQPCRKTRFSSNPLTP